MESGYIEAKSDNLPSIDPFMISVFFMENMQYLSAEIRGVKNVRSSRGSYGDQAVGYVQLKRESDICTVKGKITPEHKVRSQPYNITVTINEKEAKIISSECHGCVASYGGCKHAIAFLYWLLRRVEEPSPTEVQCYWKKALLSKVGTTVKVIRAADLKPGEQSAINMEERQGFLEKVVNEAGCNSEASLVKYFFPEMSVKKLSVHHLALNYFKSAANPNVPGFIEYCKTEMTEELCETIADITSLQYKSSFWYELRYGRITASKIYEASRCSTCDGALFEQILGAVSLPDTKAMERGRNLEDKVLDVVAKNKNLTVTKTGLILSNIYPLLGASPDGISKEYVIEVKCPTSEKTKGNYLLKGNNIAKRYLAQIQLQMLFCKKEKGLFCVADPNFETTNSVNIVCVDFDKDYIESIIVPAMQFWKESIYTSLVR